MPLSAIKTDYKKILYLRSLFLQENNFQIRYNATHERGWSDSYTFQSGKEIVGYAAIKGKENIVDRNTVFEFYLLPPFRHMAADCFNALKKTATPAYIETQSNEKILTGLLNEFGRNLQSDVILFRDSFSSSLKVDRITFRRQNEKDKIFKHYSEPEGDYVLALNRKIIATGGFLMHYNFPFADLFMEVKEDYRKMGYGSYLIQEIKKQCYLNGRVPAARCNISNTASKATLLKAGFEIAGYMMSGEIV
jgi:GNAT superfamily N-acetyltransferase